MKRVLTAVILIPLVVLALFRAPLWLFSLLVLGVALLAAREYFDIAEKTGFKPMRGLGYILLVWIFAAFLMLVNKLEVGVLFLLSLLGLIVPLLLFCFAFMVAGMRLDYLSQVLPDAAISFLLLPYIGIPLALMVVQRGMFGLGSLLLFYLMLLVWAGDITALYIGRALGKHRLAPRISPGKTWEGAVASTIGSVVIGVLLFRYTVPVEHALSRLYLLSTFRYGFFLDAGKTGPVFARYTGATWLVVLFALSVNIAAQLGDLVESALKRGADLKDSGHLLPGHGGVLDRIDALLFALPVGWLFCQGILRFFFR